MASFMLLLHAPTERLSLTKLGAADYACITREYMEWADRIRGDGHMKGGNKLMDEPGKILKSAGNRVALTDGPYAESKEIVGGFFIISAADYAEACRIAETCPHIKYGSHIEVRQVQEL
jgi:hypothetical protein